MTRLFTKSAITVVTVAMALLAGCSRNENISDTVQKDRIGGMKITVENFIAEDETRFTSDPDDGFVFDQGDRMGLAVLTGDGAFVNNLPLVYDQTEGWTVESGSEIYLIDGAEYAVYYPYDEAMSSAIASSKSADEAKDAIFSAFKAKVNQSSFVNFAGSMLMMWGGQADTSGEVPVLNINLEQVMSMVEVIFDPSNVTNFNMTFKVDTEEYTPYQYRETGNTTVSGVTPGNPCEDYLLLVKPGADIRVMVEVNFEKDDNTYEWNNRAELLVPETGKKKVYRIAIPIL